MGSEILDARLDYRGFEGRNDSRYRNSRSGDGGARRSYNSQAEFRSSRVVGPEGDKARERRRGPNRCEPGQVNGDPHAGFDHVLFALPETEARPATGEPGPDSQRFLSDISNDPGMTTVAPGWALLAAKCCVFDQFEGRDQRVGFCPNEPKADGRQPDQDRPGSEDRARSGRSIEAIECRRPPPALA
jgi:hypothetical protein